jgi:hypothetical protein
MSKIKTFKRKLEMDIQDRIHLAGGDSDQGYKIKDLSIISSTPGAVHGEFVIKVFSTKQTLPATATVNFDDDTLLAVAYYQNVNAPSALHPSALDVIIDREAIVNQDIYVTAADAGGATTPVNYYLELEQVTMTKNEQAVVNFAAALLHG